jgi:hypothetical protein
MSLACVLRQRLFIWTYHLPDCTMSWTMMVSKRAQEHGVWFPEADWEMNRRRSSRPGPVQVRLLVDTFISWYFGFPLSVSFHQCSTLIFTYMLPLPEGQTAEAWEPSKKQCWFWNRGALDREIGLLFACFVERFLFFCMVTLFVFKWLEETYENLLRSGLLECYTALLELGFRRFGKRDPIFKGRAIQWDRYVVPKRRKPAASIRCVTSQKRSDLICTAVEAWNPARIGRFLVTCSAACQGIDDSRVSPSVFRRVLCEKLVLALSSLSGCPHGTTLLPLDGFWCNLIFRFCPENLSENSSFIKIRQE